MDVHELTAAYAVDALAPEERERYESHLAQCEECRAQLAELAPAATALAYAVDAPPPPPELRGRILDAVATDNVVPLRRRRWPYAAAGVAAAAAAVLAVLAVSLSHSLSNARAERDAAARAVSILGDPRATKHALRGARGVVAVDPAGRGVIVFSGLAHAPLGKTYEAWVIPPGRAAVAAGLFGGGGGTTVVALAHGVPRGSVVATTLERAGGVRHSTQRPFASATA